MAIGPVVTRGYGTFGTAILVVTRGYSIGVAIARIGPIISQSVFKMGATVGTFGLGETLGIFKDPSDEGPFKP